jgi:hypothetical protein
MADHVLNMPEDGPQHVEGVNSRNGKNRTLRLNQGQNKQPCHQPPF